MITGGGRVRAGRPGHASPCGAALGGRVGV